jgi:hypothetical protein
MPRKPLTTRTAAMTLMAVTLGSAAGDVAGAMTAQLGYSGTDPAPIATAITTLWILDKLNRLSRR